MTLTAALTGPDGSAYFTARNVLLALNRLDDARDAFVETLKISPKESRCVEYLGLTLVGWAGWKTRFQRSQRNECQPRARTPFSEWRSSRSALDASTTQRPHWINSTIEWSARSGDPGGAFGHCARRGNSQQSRRARA